MTLNQLRKQIDQVDAEIIRLLNRRATLVLRIGQLKKKRGLPVFDSRREGEVLHRLTKEKCKPLSPSAARKIFNLILDLSRELQISSSGKSARNA